MSPRYGQGGWTGSPSKYERAEAIHPGESFTPDGEGGVIHWIDREVVAHYSHGEFMALLDETEETP